MVGILTIVNTSIVESTKRVDLKFSSEEQVSVSTSLALKFSETNFPFK